MANSLRAKLSKLRYDGHITDAEYKAFIKKMDGYEQEIRAKAIDETCLKIFNYLLSEIEWNRVLVDDWDALSEEFKEIAEQLKEGGL